MSDNTQPPISKDQGAEKAVLCPFCENKPYFEGRLTKVFFDKYPISEGHMLIVPKRHVSSLWDLEEGEYSEIFETTKEMTKTHNFGIDGWNVGVNVGKPAGQTVMHVHVHLVPRRVGDREDPRGGVRWIIPERAIYWED
jgi:diadenosine tetraphosphate (Ap4A) HIT family hydrolase